MNSFLEVVQLQEVESCFCESVLEVVVEQEAKIARAESIINFFIYFILK